MYAWIFRSLPGPLPVRITLMALALIAVVAACLVWLFPAAARQLERSTTISIGTVTSVHVVTNQV